MFSMPMESYMLIFVATLLAGSIELSQTTCSMLSP